MRLLPHLIRTAPRVYPEFGWREQYARLKYCVRGLLTPFPAAAMHKWPVSARVNKPVNDDAEVLAAVAALGEPPDLLSPPADKN